MSNHRTDNDAAEERAGAEMRRSGAQVVQGLHDLAGQRGAWECPRCRAINAWWVRQCGCKPEAGAKPKNPVTGEEFIRDV